MQNNTYSVIVILLNKQTTTLHMCVNRSLKEPTANLHQWVFFAFNTIISILFCNWRYNINKSVMLACPFWIGNIHLYKLCIFIYCVTTVYWIKEHYLLWREKSRQICTDIKWQFRDSKSKDFPQSPKYMWTVFFFHRPFVKLRKFLCIPGLLRFFKS